MIGVGSGSSWMEKGGGDGITLTNVFDIDLKWIRTCNGTDFNTKWNYLYNISHLRKRKIILKSAFKRGYVSSQGGNRTGLFESHTQTFNLWSIYLHLASLRIICMVNSQYLEHLGTCFVLTTCGCRWMHLPNATPIFLSAGFSGLIGMKIVLQKIWRPMMF